MTNPYQHQYAPQDHWTRRMDSRPQPVYDDEDRYIDLDGLDPDGDDGRYIDVSFDYDAYNRRCLQNNAPPDIGLSPPDDDDPPPLLIQILGPTAKPC